MATKKTNTRLKKPAQTLTERNKLLAIHERLRLLKSDIDPHIMDRFKDKGVLKALREIRGKVGDTMKQIEGFLKTLPSSDEKSGPDQL